MHTKHLNADKMQTNRKERMAELIKKYTGEFQALLDRYFWLKEAHEHRKNTIGLESTPEEKRIMKEHTEWFKNQDWNKKEPDQSSRAKSE